MLKGKQRKRRLAILLMAMMCVQLVPMDGLRVVKAAETSGVWEYTLINDGNEVEISKYKGSSINTSITIPSEIEGKAVTSIGDQVFLRRSSLTAVIIPDSVTNIGNFAFYGCSNLSSIMIPDSVTSIGDRAFGEIDGTEDNRTPWLITKQEENPLVVVNNSLVDGTQCSGDVIIPNSVTNIVDYAFSKCSSLRSIKIPNSVTSIGESAFGNCIGLTSIDIPSSVTSIGETAFYGCSSLSSITIPDSVTSIGRSPFGNTPWFEAKQKENPLVVVNHIVIDGTQCSGDVIIPDGVTSIGDNAFWTNAKLTGITIPDGVTSIGKYAFDNCGNLTSAIIPDSVTSIGNGAFAWCADDLTIYVKAGSYAETWAKEQEYKTADIASAPLPSKPDTGKPNTGNQNTGNQNTGNQNTGNQNAGNQNAGNQNTGNQNTGSQNSDNKVTIPKVAKVTKFKAAAKKKGFTLSWKKVSGANGYEIQVSTKKKFKGAKTYTINKNKAKYTISKLKGKKKYYIRIRAYKNYKDANGKTQKAYGTYVSVNKKTK